MTAGSGSRHMVSYSLAKTAHFAAGRNGPNRDARLWGSYKWRKRPWGSRYNLDKAARMHASQQGQAKDRLTEYGGRVGSMA